MQRAAEKWSTPVKEASIVRPRTIMWGRHHNASPSDKAAKPRANERKTESAEKKKKSLAGEFQTRLSLV